MLGKLTGNEICFKTPNHYRCLRLLVVENKRDWKTTPEYGGNKEVSDEEEAKDISTNGM